MNKKTTLLILLLTISANTFCFRLTRQLLSKTKIAVNFFQNEIPKGIPTKCIHQLNKWIKKSSLENPAHQAFAMKILEIGPNDEHFLRKNIMYLKYLITDCNVDPNISITQKNGLSSSPAGLAIFYKNIPLLDFLLSQGAYAYVEDHSMSFAAFALEIQNSQLLAILKKHNARLFPNEMHQDRYKHYQDQHPSFFMINQ